MPEPMNLRQFEPLLNQQFIVRLDDQKQLDVTLIHVEPLSAHARPGGQPNPRQPFSLIFRGPFSPILPQRIYSLKQESLGESSIFLVPIGPDAEGQRYEAVFN